MKKRILPLMIALSALSVSNFNSAIVSFVQVIRPENGDIGVDGRVGRAERVLAEGADAGEGQIQPPRVIGVSRHGRASSGRCHGARPVDRRKRALATGRRRRSASQPETAAPPRHSPGRMSGPRGDAAPPPLSI